MMTISTKALETCIDALEILVENSAENVVCVVGHDLDLDYLKKVVADGPTDERHDYEIDEIKEYVDRRESLTELTELLKPHPDAFYEWLKSLRESWSLLNCNEYDLIKSKWSSRLWKDKRSVNEILSEDLGIIPEECKRNGHRDTGRGVCAECEAFLPSSDGEHWA